MFHVVVLLAELIEDFFDFFLIFAPVKFHFDAFVPREFAFRVVADVFSEKSVVIGQFASTAIFFIAVRAAEISGTSDKQEAKGLFLLIY